MAQRKNPELDAKHQAVLKKMMQIPENKTCADCRGPSPRWASTNLGVFLCISCSGIHRKLGTHISQVRSVTLDTWTPAQMAHFTKFGNARAAQYFEACVPPNFQRPPPGDSMQMERFIRDKYENKRYITVENGGLGGGSTESSYRTNIGSSYGGGLGLRASQVPGTLSYVAARQNGAQTTRRTGASFNSYGGRFGSGSHGLSGGTSGPSYSRRTRDIMGPAASAYTSRPGNAIQRASTMKELINMGFSAQHAARAVEATEGDLQKAVDWVLEHKDQGSLSTTSSFARPPQQAPQRDLLDFDDPAPHVSARQKAPDQARPKAMGLELLMSKPLAAAPSKSADEQADFADFGAFESALPAAKEYSSVPITAAANGSLTSTIRNIYKQSPPQRPQPNLSVMPHIARLDQPKQAGSPLSPIRTMPSPKLMAQKAAEPKRQVPQVDLGLTSFTGLASSQTTFSSATTDASKSLHPTSSRATPVNLDDGPAPPPPPPPQVGVPMSKSTQESCSPSPPPPDSPPPTGEISIGQTKTSTSDSRTVVGSSLHNQTPDQDDNAAAISAEEPTPQEDEEEEDPFAALSFMAMKSAKSNIKKGNAAPHINVQNAVGSVGGIPRQVGSDKQNGVTVNATGGIDLDELLG